MIMAFKSYSETNGCLLVYANSREQACLIGADTIGSSEIKALRMPEFDQFFRGITVIKDNLELPEGAPYFFKLEEVIH